MSDRHELGDHITPFPPQWDNFPFPAMLIRRNRTIVAANAAAGKAGIVSGTRCCDLGRKESHRVCQADSALREKTAKRLTAYSEDYGMVMDSYWVPVDGEDQLYIHFSIDITEYAAERMFPAGAEG